MTTETLMGRAEGQQALDPNALARLGRAIERLGGDTAYVMESITEFIEALDPVERDATPPHLKDWLIESGSMTEERFEAAVAEVERGALKVMELRSFLKFVSDTLTLDEAAGVLDITEDEARQAVADRTLHAFEINGRLRFPQWQFDIREPDHRLRGLTDIVRSIPKDRDWLSVQGIMTLPHEDLNTEGRQTAVEWLRNGGDVARIRRLVRREYRG
ncbi:hypothetical protein [Microbacterium sp. PA5]|uniref:hypothetical protein n=1 Tax=Microbacterium sp. PA5 TaxID=3416654 RepID=UPI003CF3862E